MIRIGAKEDEEFSRRKKIEWAKSDKRVRGKTGRRRQERIGEENKGKMKQGKSRGSREEMSEKRLK